MTHIRECYKPTPVGVNGSLQIRGPVLAGVLVATAGTVSVTDADGSTLVASMPLYEGGFLRIPIFFNTNMGGTITFAGGASGTVLT